MNAAIYSRFSPRRYAEECESIKVQLDRCRAYCKAMDYTIIGEFSDEAKSGKDRVRKGLDDALKAIKEHKAVLVVRDFSRMSRDVRDSLDLRDEVMAAGAGLVDLELRLDTSGPLGKMVFTIIQSVKQYQREDTGQRTSEAKLWKQKNGQRQSNHVPYGFKVGQPAERNGKPVSMLEPEPKEQEIIKDILDLRQQGLAYNAIKRMLAEEKVPCRGKRWNTETVRRIVLSQESQRAPAIS